MYTAPPNVAPRDESKVNDTELLLVANVIALLSCKYFNCPALLEVGSPK